jgi:BCD family chlorophyll transporter-like MFS transporter
VAGFGAIAGLIAFSAVLFAAPMASAGLFAVGVCLVGFGAGLFAHGTLTASMAMAEKDATGLALGAWGAVQALAAGVAIASGGLISDTVASLARSGRLVRNQSAERQGPALDLAALHRSPADLAYKR